MVHVKVRGSASLWESKVEKENGLDSVVEWDPEIR